MVSDMYLTMCRSGRVTEYCLYIAWLHPRFVRLQAGSLMK